MTNFGDEGFLARPVFFDVSFILALVFLIFSNPFGALR